MARKYLYFGVAVVFLLTIIAGCTTQTQGNPEPKIRAVNYTTLSSSFSCLDMSPLWDEFLVIDSDEQYQQLLQYVVPSYLREGCENFELPEIDFSQDRLLVGIAHASGCSQTFTPSMLLNEQTNDLEFKISVTEKGHCEPAVVSTHWILAPRVGEEVIFDIIRTIES